MQVQGLFDSKKSLTLCQVRPSDSNLRCQATEMITGFAARSYGSVSILVITKEDRQLVVSALNNHWGIENSSLAADSNKRYLICGIYYDPDDATYELEIYLPKHPEAKCWTLHVIKVL